MSSSADKKRLIVLAIVAVGGLVAAYATGLLKFGSSGDAGGSGIEAVVRPAAGRAARQSGQTMPAGGVELEAAASDAPRTLPASDSIGGASGAASAPATFPATLAARPDTAPSTLPAAIAGETRPATLPAVVSGPGSSRSEAERSGDERRSSSRSSGSSRSGRSSGSRSSISGAATRTAEIAVATFKIERPAPIAPEYRGLLERSLFSKDAPRPPVAPRPEGPKPEAQPPPAAAPPEANIALRGLVVEDVGSYAFLQYMDSNRQEIREVGENVARGKIAAISLSELVYEMADGTQTKVQIGYTFAGQPAVTATAALSTSGSGGSGSPPAGSSGSRSSPRSSGVSASTAPTTAPATTQPADATLTLEEMMRRRRAEQGGR